MMMSEEQIKLVLADANRLVESWPAWKRNILEHSARPTRTTARTPLNPDGTPIEEPQ